MTINIIDFWPQCFTPNTHSVTFSYAEVPNNAAFSAKFSYDSSTQSMVLNEYNSSGVWQDTWYLKNENGQVTEWRDDIPASGLYELLGVQKIQEIYSSPIIWGTQAVIGTTTPFEWSFNLPMTGSWPPQTSQSGVQEIVWEELLPTFTLSNGKTYSNVLVQVYQQKWTSGNFTGARWWMAKGIGPIAIQWMAPNPNNPSEFIVEPRQDAVIIVN